MASCSICHMLCSSSLASFIVGVWEKQLYNFVTNSSSEKLLQDNITCLTAPADFLNSSVLNPLLLALQDWSTSSIESSNDCLLVPSKVFIAVNIESLDLSYSPLLIPGRLLADFSGWWPSFPGILTECLPIQSG